MDILNFIHWIRSGRKFTNVDPSTTLIPVGVRDERRDDKYLTGSISVVDLAAQINKGTIEIPKIIIKPLKGDIQARLDFYQNDDWQKYNPKIFLFKQKSARQKNKNGVPVHTGSGFVHTPHLEGTNSKFWGGHQKYDLQYGGNTILRHTEFNLPTFKPYSSFMMSDIGLDRFEWITVVEDVSPSCLDQVLISWVASTDVGEAVVNANGFYNGKPKYEFQVNGNFGIVNYTLYFDPVTNWSVGLTTEFGLASNDIVSNFSTDCPVNINEEGASYTCLNNTELVFFYSFNVSINPQKIKRQSVVSDFDTFSPLLIGDLNSPLYFIMSGKSRGNGYKEINCEKDCIPAISHVKLSNQKQKFKLAVVIDNPNPTPDSPYLIGPMSDTFVLRFSQSGVPKFTSDHVSKIVV